jgi:hypothetical protein
LHSGRAGSRNAGLVAVASAAGADGEGADCVGDARGVRHARGAALDLHDVGLGCVEVGLRERDLVVRQVVDDVGGAQEGVAEHAGRLTGGADACLMLGVCSDVGGFRKWPLTENADGLAALVAGYND